MILGGQKSWVFVQVKKSRQLSKDEKIETYLLHCLKTKSMYAHTCFEILSSEHDVQL